MEKKRGRPHGYKNGMFEIDRFLSHTEYDENGCLIWIGSGWGKKVYGGFYPDGSKEKVPTHRWIMKYTLGEIFDESLRVLHNCDVPRCVNPEHLYQGTDEDNMRDMDSRGRRKSAWGEGSGKNKLTEEQIHEIRKLYDGSSREVQGITGKLVTVGVKDIAEKYGVTSASITEIGKRKTWRHLPERHPYGDPGF